MTLAAQTYKYAENLSDRSQKGWRGKIWGEK